MLKQLVRSRLDPRVRDAVWALRTRGDASLASALARDWLDWHYPAGTDEQHLQATLAWLCAAQDAGPAGGVASFYDVRAGCWGPLYPETTGYIITSFLRYARQAGQPAFAARAERMADWLLTLQLPGGAFPIGPLWPEWERAPLIFDTGQIIDGLVSAFEATGRAGYLDAARRAGDWLAAVQAADGAWRQFTPLSHANTYNARTAWALLRLHQAGGNPSHRAAAARHLAWVLEQQMPDGWFRNAGFTPAEDPLTHTIAYTIEGLLEAGRLLDDERMLQAARLAADALAERQAAEGSLRGRYGPGWQSDVTWSCLTGNAQMAMIWLRLHALTGDASYQAAAQLANRSVKQAQNRRARLPGVAGGIAGSAPIYGAYEPYRLLNWAAKFFVDSLLLAQQAGQATAAAAAPAGQPA